MDTQVEGRQVEAALTDFIVTNFLFGDVQRMPGGDASLVEAGVIDSTGVLELIEFLETSFGVEVAEEETIPENLDSIERLTRFVAAKLATATSSP